MIHKSSCEMLPLTALCAYSQYEAVEARLGDPGRLPRGGGCEAPSARTNKKPCLSPFCFTAMRRGMKPAICLFVSCRSQTPSDRRTQIIHLLIHSLFVYIQMCINDWGHTYSNCLHAQLEHLNAACATEYEEAEVTVLTLFTFTVLPHTHTHTHTPRCRGTLRFNWVCSQWLSSSLPGRSQPPHPGICSPTTSIIKDRLHKEPKRSSKQTTTP